MDTYTIRHILSRLLCKCRIPKFYVLAKNELSLIDFKDPTPFCAIINTEDNNVRLMGHWCALIVLADRTWVWFESYGGSPQDYGIKLPPKINSGLLNISQPFQSNHSLVCGLYSIILCVLVSQGHSWKHFLSLFHVNSKVANDRKTITFFKQIKLNLVKQGGQYCCSKVKYLESRNGPED